jgi:phosphatidylglycerophosphatase A
LLIATWGGTGLSPFAPGTVGSLAALPFAWGLLAWGGWPALAWAAFAACALGTWATAVYLRTSTDKDPAAVVIDEVAGQWIALLPATLEPLPFVAGFALFRLFDIWKPWPIGWADRHLPGALGVMADDVIAGTFAAAGVWGLMTYLGG